MRSDKEILAFLLEDPLVLEYGADGVWELAQELKEDHPSWALSLIFDTAIDLWINLQMRSDDLNH